MKAIRPMNVALICLRIACAGKPAERQQAAFLSRTALVLFCLFLLLLSNVKAVELRVSPQQQEQSDSASRALDEGIKLFQQGTPEALQAAIKKFEFAATTCHNLNDNEMEAVALEAIGKAYLKLENPKKAIEYFEQALALYERAHNLTGKVTILYQIGKANYNL